jgi:hypothetical protein
MTGSKNQLVAPKERARAMSELPSVLGLKIKIQMIKNGKKANGSELWLNKKSEVIRDV